MTSAEEETMPMEGLFTLQKPKHLLHKLEWEYTQWQAEPWNSYRAWNFFVTVEHLPEWLGRAHPPSCRKASGSTPSRKLTSICASAHTWRVEAGTSGPTQTIRLLTPRDGRGDGLSQGNGLSQDGLKTPC
jgi:hypothetical protein